MMLANVYETARDWLLAGHRVAAAVLVDIEGSAPLESGATMLVDDEGRIEGSVTGGCVEGALVEEAQAVLGGAAPRIVTYGFSDEVAAGVGLTCGGTVHLYVSLLDGDSLPALEEVVERVQSGEPVAIATVLDAHHPTVMAVLPEDVVGSLGGRPELDHAVSRDARGFLDHALSGVRRYGVAGESLDAEVAVHVHAFAAAPRLVVFGAVDFSAAVAVLGKQLGFHVTVCDARRPFLESGRFSAADERVVDWPDRYLAGRSLGPRDVVLVFTHDAKFDVPAVEAALATGVGYIGALGSRWTHEDRTRRLLDAGIPSDALARVASPCGLDIGARTPAETAVSVFAEIITVETGRSGRPLSTTSGRIHAEKAGQSQRVGT